MERFRVVGGARLAGDVRVTGAKNSVLKVMAAALLAEGRTTLTDVPHILDVEIMGELLRRLGCEVDYDQTAATVAIDVPATLGHQADYDLVRRIRASICVLGPLIARCGEAEVAMPGGDAIGSRPLDFHIAGLTKLGAELTSEHGYIVARAPHGLTGATVWLDFPSVGATENVLMAAVLARGTTVIDNAAREPEIVDLCQMLAADGRQDRRHRHVDADDRGRRRADARDPRDRARPDRGRHLGVRRGDDPGRRHRPRRALGAPGDRPRQADDRRRHGRRARRRLPGGDGQAGPTRSTRSPCPTPGLATDLQPLVMALNSIADGAAMVTENIFEGRFVFASELARLGAHVRTDGHHAVVRGVPRLSGAPVRASDIRAGAALTLAGLVGEGVTYVSDIFHVDRGYPGFDSQLRALGADVTREPDPDAELFD